MRDKAKVFCSFFDWLQDSGGGLKRFSDFVNLLGLGFRLVESKLNLSQQITIQVKKIQGIRA